GGAVHARLSAFGAREGEAAQDRSRDAEAAVECRLLRWREEAQRDFANDAARPLALRARRDRFRPRHRCDPHRRRRRQCTAESRAGIAGDHPLPAAARLHRAGPRACAVRRARGPLRRPRACARARADGLCRIRRQGRLGIDMDLPVQQFRTKAEQAYLDMLAAAGKALPGSGDSFVSGLGRQAIETYGRLGLPHRRIEAWKYTDLRARLTDVNPLLKAEGIAVSDADLARALGS